MHTQLPKSFLLKSPASLLLIVALSVFTSEALVMLMLYYLPGDFSLFTEAILDAAFLVVLVSPTLYFFLFRPMADHIRERAEIEEILRKNEEEQFKIMIRTSLDAFQITNLRRDILEINDAYCDMFGYDRDALLFKNVSDMEVGVTNEETEKYFINLLETGSDRLEINMRRKDGQVRIIEMSSNFSNLHGGRIYSFLRDITENKKAEEELHRHRLRLEELVAIRTAQIDRQADTFASANANLSSKLEACRQKASELKKYADNLADHYHNGPCGYFSLDEEGRVIQCNDNALKWLGLIRTDVEGKMKFADLLAPDSRNIFLGNFLSHINGENADNLEIGILQKSGAELPVLLSTRSIRDSNNRWVSARCVMLKRS